MHAEIGRFDVQCGQARTWLSTRLPLRSSDDHVAGLLGVAHDITEQRHALHDRPGGDKDSESGRQEEMVTEAGNTAGAVLQDVEHRVRDNLQFGISLPALQARSERDTAAQRALTQAQARVAVVAWLHEQMAASGSRAGLDYAAYARKLAADALAAVRSRPDVALDFCCPGTLLLRPEVAAPLSLVLRELLDNAVWHAFANGSASTLTLRIAREEGPLRLLVADDGVGLATGVDPARAGSPGLAMVEALLQQLGGTLTLVQQRRGAAYLVAVPLQTHEASAGTQGLQRNDAPALP